MKNFQYLPDYGQKVFTDGWPLKAAGGALLAILFPTSGERTAIIAVLALIVLDTATGAVAARLDGETITSAKFGRVAVKVFGYFSAILSVSLAFRALPSLESIYEPAISSVTSLLAITELLSIFENLKRMEFPLPNWIEAALNAKKDDVSKGA